MFTRSVVCAARMSQIFREKKKVEEASVFSSFLSPGTGVLILIGGNYL